MKERKEHSANQVVQFFNEAEFWFYLRQLMTALMALRNSNIFHGDIQPHNILIMPDKTIKLFDPKYFLPSKTAYTRKLMDFEYCAPLCPKLVNALRSRKPHPNHSPDKAEVYSIGITFLSMMINEDFNRYYDWQNCVINYPIINQRIERLKELKQDGGFKK